MPTNPTTPNTNASVDRLGLAVSDARGTGATPSMMCMSCVCFEAEASGLCAMVICSCFDAE